MPIVPASSIEMTIASSPAHLPVVRAAVAEAARLVGFDETCASAIVLAVDEALANVIKHAYEGRADESIDIAITALVEEGTQTGLQIVVADSGKSVPAPMGWRFRVPWSTWTWMRRFSNGTTRLR